MTRTVDCAGTASGRPKTRTSETCIGSARFDRIITPRAAPGDAHATSVVDAGTLGDVAEPHCTHLSLSASWYQTENEPRRSPFDWSRLVTLTDAICATPVKNFIQCVLTAPASLSERGVLYDL